MSDYKLKTVSKTKTVALVGNSNVGKSTLFNTITGGNQKIVNAPGTTVTVAQGKWGSNTLIDLPGIISLIHNSIDEKAAVDVLVDKSNLLYPDLIILVADAMHISRSLYLYAQLKKLDIPIVFAISMADIAKKRGIEFDTAFISKTLEAPAILLDARDKKSVKSLEEKVSALLENQSNSDEKEIKKVSDNQKVNPVSFAKLHFEDNIKWVSSVEKKLSISDYDKLTFSDRLDKVLLNKIIGPFVFLGLLFLVFQLSTFASFPIIDFIDNQVRDFVISGYDNLFGTGLIQAFIENTVIETVFTLLEFVPPMLFIFISLAILEGCGYLSRAALVTDKLMRSIGLEGKSVIPIIIGFGCNLPAIKATRVLKTSTIRKSTAFVIPYSLCSARFSIFIVLAHAFFYETAGLIVFLLYIISVIFILGISLTIKIIRKTINKRKGIKEDAISAMIIHLPVYQLPKLSYIFKSSFSKLSNFLLGAGRVIVCVLAVLWCLQAIPVPRASLDGTSADDTFGNVKNVNNSAYGVLARGTAQIFEPAGFGDWHLSQAVISGFLAKEVVLGSLENAYSINSDEASDSDKAKDSDESATNSRDLALSKNLQNTLNLTSGGRTSLAAFSFMLFILLYIPCMATVIGIKSEFGLRQSLVSVGVSLTLAYVFSVLFYQIAVHLF
ncbi:MAG: ferrous iron transporter B [Bifidobacteriaceae bacterium]|jgi:ferrous iron transport protein B|nr:ferrous iron transporter B [Bifidobacteriaceae bacterium]